MKGISLKGRLSKKLLIGVAAILVLSGAAGGYVVYSGMLSHEVESAEGTLPSGIACTTVDFIKLNRGGQRWLRKYVRTESASGQERVRTALRVAGVLAQAEKADLYQVVVLDQAGPADRAGLRGPAIGAEVLFAPDPSKLPDMSQPFIARYNSATANAAGLFHGDEVTLSPDEIRTALAAISDRTDCLDPTAIVADAHAEGDGAGAHGAPAKHEETAAEGHGEAATSEGHGEAAPSEDHGAAAPAEGHAEAAPAEGHEAATVDASHAGPAEAEAKGGFLSSVIGMIPGMGASSAEPSHASEPAGEKKGLLSSVIGLIPGMGGGESGTHEAEAAKSEAHDVPAAESAGHGAEGAVAQDATIAPSGHGTVTPDAEHAPLPVSEAPAHAGSENASAEVDHAVTVPEAVAPHDNAQTGQGTAEHEASEEKHAAPAVVPQEETGATH